MPALSASSSPTARPAATPVRSVPLRRLIGRLGDARAAWSRAAELARPALDARTTQHILAAHGHLPTEGVTGRFDGPTAAAVAGFQRRVGLPANGVVGRRTADALLGGPMMIP